MFGKSEPVESFSGTLNDLGAFYADTGPERVGFILNDGSIVEVENVFSEPTEGFDVSAEDLITVADRAVASWHTHPGVKANLSSEDYSSFLCWPDLIHYVITSDKIAAYRVQTAASFNPSLRDLMIKRRIFLHGPLGELHSGPVEIYADTVAEAINGLSKMLRIKIDPVAGRKRVKVVGFETHASLFEKNDQEELHIVPAFAGAKKGLVQVIVGAVLVVAAFAVGVATPWGQFLVNAGAAMILGGLTQLLFPVPRPDNDKNYSYVGAPGNTTKVGTPISLILGEVQVFGQILSYNVNAVGT